MVETDSISSDPSLVPGGGVEAGRSWVCCPESRCTEWGWGATVGNLPRRSTFLASLNPHGDGDGERHIKKSEKGEKSSRAQRGCGLACGFNQLVTQGV